MWWVADGGGLLVVESKFSVRLCPRPSQTILFKVGVLFKLSNFIKVNLIFQVPGGGGV